MKLRDLFLWRIRWRWPLRWPVQIEHIHRYDKDPNDANRWNHSDLCWCRREDRPGS